MRLLPEKIVESGYGFDLDLDEPYEEVEQSEVLERLFEQCFDEDFVDIKIDVSSDKGIVLLTITKEKVVAFCEEIEKIRKQDEYDKKFLSLRERIGDDAVKYLIGTSIDPDELIKYLPSKKLIKKDYELYRRLFGFSCGYHYPDEGLLSIELAKKLAMGESLDEYPEKLEYHFYWYPKTEKSVCDATFTKQEFLESIKEKPKTKKLVRK